MISLLSEDEESENIGDKIPKKKNNVLRIDKKRSFDETRVESIDDDNQESEDSFFSNCKTSENKTKSKTVSATTIISQSQLPTPTHINKKPKITSFSKKNANSKFEESNLTKFFDFDPSIHNPLLTNKQISSNNVVVVAKKKSTNAIVLHDDDNNKLHFNTKKTVYDISSDEDDECDSNDSSSSDLDSFYKENDNDDNDDENLYNNNNNNIDDIFNKNNASNDYLKRVASIDIGRNNFAIFIYDVQQNQVIFWYDTL